MDLMRLNGESDFEWKLRLCLAKKNKELDADWIEIRDALGLDISPDQLRKQAVGYAEYEEYQKSKIVNGDSDIQNKLDEIKKERYKLQTLNVEKTRIDRATARQELFYEYIGQCCKSLTPPVFNVRAANDYSKEYILTLADIHYGAKFKSANNEYSPEIAKERFDYLLDEIVLISDKIKTLYVLELGDTVQGILRANDLKINDSSVVKAVVEVCHLIASFLNELSKYVNIEYYHVPFANHTQIRPLGTKASEIADEDYEYIISHYIKDLVKDNSHINCHLADEKNDYISFNVGTFDLVSSHGHNVKNVDEYLKDISVRNRVFYDYAILGHYHGGQRKTSFEAILNDCETIIAPSFCGSDPYSDSLNKGSKASCLLLGVEEYHGITETRKIILN